MEHHECCILVLSSWLWLLQRLLFRETVCRLGGCPVVSVTGLWGLQNCRGCPAFLIKTVLICRVFQQSVRGRWDDDDDDDDDDDVISQQFSLW
jgi:hypothetical protein